MVNDYIERCYNVGISQLGTNAKRFGYSCLFIRDSSASSRQTPSCEKCTADRINLLLNGNCDNTVLHQCQNCSDWWSDATNVSPDEYPNPPSFELRNLSEPPNVKLSFNMIRNSLMRVEEWHNQHRHEKYSTGVLRKYLQLICIGYGKEIHKEMRDSEVSATSQLHLYHLNEFESLGIEVDFFIATVMHKFFLGCQKKCIGKQLHEIGF